MQALQDNSNVSGNSVREALELHKAFVTTFKGTSETHWSSRTRAWWARNRWQYPNLAGLVKVRIAALQFTTIMALGMLALDLTRSALMEMGDHFIPEASGNIMVEYLSIAIVTDRLLERRFREGEGVIVLGSDDPPARRAVPNVIIDLCDSDDEDNPEQPEQDTSFAQESDSDEDMLGY